MGFLDKAKAAANELATKADTALASSGLSTPGATSPDKLLRDLGVIAYLEAAGRTAPAGERARVMQALQELESRNALTLTLQTTPGTSAVPPPPGGMTPPPPAGGMTPPPPAGGMTPTSPTGSATAPPPPPPSWMQRDANDS